MSTKIVGVLCDHDVLAAGLAMLVGSAWHVQRVGRAGRGPVDADVLLVDADDPGHDVVLEAPQQAPVVAWSWRPDEVADACVHIAATLGKQAGAAAVLATLARAVNALVPSGEVASKG